MSAMGHERRPLQHTDVRQLPLCPVRDRGSVAVQYVAKGQTRTFTTLAADDHCIIRGDQPCEGRLGNVPCPLGF